MKCTPDILWDSCPSDEGGFTYSKGDERSHQTSLPQTSNAKSRQQTPFQATHLHTSDSAVIELLVTLHFDRLVVVPCRFLAQTRHPFKSLNGSAFRLRDVVVRRWMTTRSYVWLAEVHYALHPDTHTWTNERTNAREMRLELYECWRRIVRHMLPRSQQHHQWTMCHQAAPFAAKRQITASRHTQWRYLSSPFISVCMCLVFVL